MPFANTTDNSSLIIRNANQFVMIPKLFFCSNMMIFSYFLRIL